MHVAPSVTAFDVLGCLTWPDPFAATRSLDLPGHESLQTPQATARSIACPISDFS